MKLALLDIGIIVAYMVATLFIGFWISKKASKNLQAYFLGGKSLPWYMLGLSNASGMFDITGTMWTVSIFFIYGLKGAFIPWLWPVWNQIFLMIFLAVWLRRSNVMTGAEWIRFRFGNGRGARIAHDVVVIFAVVAAIGFIAYGFEGIGKFSAEFMPWNLQIAFSGITISSPDMYAILIMGFTTIYVIKGGMYSVVLTEILQFAMMTIASVVVGIIAMNLVSPEQIEAAVPAGWKDLFFSWKLQLDWSNIIPEVNNRIAKDGFDFFGWAIMMMLFKGILVSIAGPVPSYDMQRILATRTPKESAKMSGLVSLVLHPPRTFMIIGLTVIALVYLTPEITTMGNNIDFEMVLPYTLNNFIPPGIRGLLLAGLIAAFMSTFAANVNAAPAYLVNDIFKRYINPHASNKTNVRLSYLASFLIVVVGISLGFVIDTIDSITKWIVSGLFGGYTAANLLKWIWWRFNGSGYFWGMLTGLAGSLLTPLILPQMTSLNAFPIVLAIAMAGSLIGTFATPPEKMEVLKNFYKKTRPWGLWKPVYQEVAKEDPGFEKNNNFGRDMFNSAIGIIWQMTLVVAPMYLIIREYSSMWITVGIFVLTSAILKFNWLDKLEEN